MLSPVRPRLFGTTNLVTPLHHLCQRGVALSAKIPPKMCIPPRVPADFLPDLRIPWLVWDRMITVSRSFSKRFLKCDTPFVDFETGAPLVVEGVVPAADVAPGGVIEKGPSNDPPPDHDEVVLITKVGSSAENPLKKFPPLPKSMLKKPGGLSPDQAGTPGPPVNVPGTTPLPPPTIDWGGQVPRAIIFSNKRLFAEKVAQRLTAQLYKVAHLHSKLDQAAREEAVRKFQTGEARVLVATNIAARGLDFDVKLVVQMDLPDEITSYTHRIGRTGRLGDSTGVAVGYATKSNKKIFRSLAAFLGLNGQEVPTWLASAA